MGRGGEGRGSEREQKQISLFFDTLAVPSR